MKLLHLIYDHINNPWVGGGGAVRANEICRRLASRGHQITILSGRYPGAHDYRDDGLEYRFIGSCRNYMVSTFSYACGAARFVRRHDDEFDLIVEDFAPWNPIFSRFLTNKPVILHINHKEGKGMLKRWSILGIPFFLIEEYYPRLFKNVTALSEWTKIKFKIKDAAVIPAGINAVYGIESNDDNYILYIGRIHIKNKGLDTLLEAVQGFDTKLRLVGKGRDEKKLKEMTERFRLGNIDFIGFLDEEAKIKMLRGSKFLILPSRFEGQGIVVLEAAACGKPVIVSDIPELRYAVDAGFGMSFKAGDAKDLAGKIKLLLERGALRNDMGQNGMEFAEKYTWDKIAEDYENYLRILMHRSGRNR